MGKFLFGSFCWGHTSTGIVGKKCTVSYVRGKSTHDFGINVDCFIGDKEEYGQTIIIQGMDGIDYWYSNVENINVKLYDYIESDNIIATAKDNKLYVLFMKDGKFLNYEEYI